MADKVRVHLLVSGRVQGVFYRAGAQKKAREFGLTGWAHNTVDGKVEIMCEGEKEDIKKFVEWCSEGTELAKVDSCEVDYKTYSGEFDDFSIREFGF